MSDELTSKIQDLNDTIDRKDRIIQGLLLIIKNAGVEIINFDTGENVLPRMLKDEK